MKELRRFEQANEIDHGVFSPTKGKACRLPPLDTPIGDASAASRGVKYQERGPAMTGTVKKILKDKGFGFIVPDEGSDDVFFHRGSLAPRVQFEDVTEGDTVQFQTRRGEKGVVAFDLKIR